VTWFSKAVCSNDEHSERWLSYNLLDIEYAKSGCAKCSVHKQCISNAMNNDSDIIAGVIAGVSEYERLLIKLQKDR
jgi:hypothetical protein